MTEPLPVKSGIRMLFYLKSMGNCTFFLVRSCLFITLITISRVTSLEKRSLGVFFFKCFLSFPQTKTSKDGNLAPFLVSDVFIDGEDEHERKEEASSAKYVPDVMPEVSTELVLQQIGALTMCSVSTAYPS